MSTSAGAERPHPDSHNLSDDDDNDQVVASSSGHKPMGFGNIRRMGVHNVFTRGQIIPYILRWQLRVVLDFTQSLNPLIIPYQNLAFWTGTWITNPTQNYATFIQLQKLAAGMIFTHSDFTLELLDVTRERILMSGSTNVTAFDSEDGQPLYISIADRDYETYPLASNKDVTPYRLQAAANKEWHKDADTYTKVAQIPTKHVWTRRWTWPRPNHNYLWEIGMLINDRNLYRVLMPGAQGQTLLPPHTKLNNQTEIMLDNKHSEYGYEFHATTATCQLSTPAYGATTRA
jgi:hypothetical protein